jgi:hypothetical protein
MNKLVQIWLNSQDIIRDTIPCRICGNPTTFNGTELCDNCWEVTRRLSDFVQCQNGLEYIKEFVK